MSRSWARVCPKGVRKSRILANAVWMFSGEITRLGIQAIYFIVIARHLGSVNYGSFATALALVGILGAFASWGWGNILIKHVSRDRQTFAGIWGQALLMVVITGGVLTVFAVVFAAEVFGETISGTLLLSVAAADLLFLRLIHLTGYAYVAHEQLSRTAALYFLLSAVRLLGALSLLAIGNGTVEEWALLYCAATGVVATVAVAMAIGELGRPHFRRPFSKTDFVEGFHFSLSQSSTTIYNDVDKAILGRLGAFEAVGIYTAAYRIIEVTFTPVRSLLVASYARFFKEGEAGIAATTALARQLLLPSLVYAVAASLFLVFGAPLLTRVLGDSFAESTSAIRFLAAILVLRSIQVFGSDALTGAGYQHWRSSLQLLVALGNVALNALLIPIFSWRGAAAASVLCEAALACGIWILVRCAGQGSSSSAPSVLLDTQYSMGARLQ